MLTLESDLYSGDTGAPWCRFQNALIVAGTHELGQVVIDIQDVDSHCGCPGLLRGLRLGLSSYHLNQKITIIIPQEDIHIETLLLLCLQQTLLIFF